jgi:hypothetical protein
MLLQLLTILSTAVLSSLLTLALAYWYFDRRLKRRLDQRLSELQEEFGSVIQERVRRGVLEGVASIPSAEVLKDTGQTLSTAAGDLVRSSLGTLLRGSSADPED